MAFSRTSPWTALVPALVLTGAAPACFVTDAAGVEPGKSYTGEELRLLLARNQALGWMLGGEAYIDSKQSLTATDDSLFLLTDYGDFPEWFNTAFTLYYSSTPLDTHRYYRRKSADDCLMMIQATAGMLTLLYLESVQSARDVPTRNGNTLNFTFVGGSDFQKAMLLAVPATDFCKFEQTGRLIESKDFSL